MIYRADKVIEGPWVRLSLDVFFEKASASQSDLEPMLDSIVYARSVFQSAHILSSQGDRIANALHSIRSEVLNLLSLSGRMPESLSPSRFPLVRHLYKVDTLLDDLLVLLSPPRSGSPTSSNEAMALHQQRETQHNFSLLVPAFEGMLQELSIVLDKARFLQETFK